MEGLFNALLPLLLNAFFLTLIGTLTLGEFTAQWLKSKLTLSCRAYSLLRLLLLLLILSSLGLWLRGPVRDFLLVNLIGVGHTDRYVNTIMLIATLVFSLLEGIELKRCREEITSR